MSISSFRAASSRSLVKVLAGLTLGGGILAGAAVPANASAPQAAPAVAAPNAAAAGVMSTAQSLFGVPYRYGGTTPAGFDCSGYTQYVFGRNGVGLPRTANDQMYATRWISAAAAQPGDLVFFTSGGRAYHASIYAGNGWIYDAPHAGSVVGARPIWTSQVVYARAIG